MRNVSAEQMLRELHGLYEPLRGGWGGVPDPVRVHRRRDGKYVLVLTRYRWEMEPRSFVARSAAAVIEKAWKASSWA